MNTKRLHRILAVVLPAVLCVAAATAAQKSDQADVQLQAAIHKETVEGDLDQAIKLYKDIVAKYSKNHAAAAAALVHMGQAYEKLGNAEAQKAYERIVREYSDQTQIAAEARRRLTALQGPASSHAVAREIWTTTEPLVSASLPSISPDGRYLTFTSYQAGVALAVRDLASGTTRILPSNCCVYGNAVSPDSRQVAYLWTPTPQTPEVRVISLDGGAPRTIYNGKEGSMTPTGWTPDGKQLLAVQSLPDHTSRIVMLSVQDGSVRPLKSLAWEYPQASISRDGRYIAYSAPDGKTTSSDIFILATDGSRESSVVHPANDFAPIWSPDDSRVLFMSDRTGNLSLWSVPVEGGRPKGPAELVKADMGRARPLGMSRSGSLYYTIPGGRANIYTAELGPDMKAAKAPVLATERFINSNFGPAWSPDGQQLAYYSIRGASVALMVRTQKTGEDREIPLQIVLDPLGISGLTGPKWFPDGRSVLVLGYEPQRRFSSFFRIELASGKAEVVHRLNQAIGVFAFAPDGKAIFYHGSRVLLRFDLETRQETELSKGTAVPSFAVSPDSKQLAFIRDLSFQATSVGVIPAAGGEIREVFRNSPSGAHGRFNSLAWSADGQYLLFTKPESAQVLGFNYEVWRVAVAGGQPEPLGISIKGAEIHNPHMHADGRQLVFAADDSSRSELWALENFLPATNSTTKEAK